MKAARLLVEHFVPPELRNYERKYTSGGFNDLLADVAKTHPDDYEKFIKNLGDTGRHASFRQGETLTMHDMEPVIDKEAYLAEMEKEITQARRESKSKDEFEQKRMGIWSNYSERMEKDTQKAGLAQGNNIAYSVVSGARGKAPQLKAMVTTPALYADAKGRTIPLFVKRSFGEGLRPAEYLASTFGTRGSIATIKRGTAQGGDLLKQLVNVTSPLTITQRSSDNPNGIDLDITDPSLKYRVLAQSAGGFPAGTLLNARALAELKRKKVENVIVRSPLTDTTEHGLAADSVGGLNSGKLYSIGDAAGITSSTGIGEPLAQSSLSSKHLAGMTKSKKIYSGFDVVNQLVQSPEHFPDRATVAEIPGKISKIMDAPQGGKYIHIDDEEHYVPEGYDLMVKPGQKVEAGDQLSDGIVDPKDIVRLRGLGEGRRYYANRLKQALDDSGIATDLKHTEVVARAALNHVVITDPDGMNGHLPDDVVPYSELAANYTPPEDTVKLPAHETVGKYLQEPALHYTIGTKLTPRMAEHLHKRGFKDLLVSDEEPGFRPDMTRLRTAAAASGSDWLQKLQGSYQKGSLIDSATRGEDTETESSFSWSPRLAIGKNFGEKAHITGKF